MVAGRYLLLIMDQVWQRFRGPLGLGIGALLLLALLLYRSQTGGEGDDRAETYPYPRPTLLPIPPTPPADIAPLTSGMTLPEDWLHLYPYDPPAYPQFAALVPADTPCATWENRGLVWAHNDNPEIAELPPWSVIIELRRYRFCGFPEPYPPKPE